MWVGRAQRMSNPTAVINDRRNKEETDLSLVFNVDLGPLITIRQGVRSLPDILLFLVSLVGLVGRHILPNIGNGLGLPKLVVLLPSRGVLLLGSRRAAGSRCSPGPLSLEHLEELVKLLWGLHLQK